MRRLSPKSYTDVELDQVQATYGLTFPADFVALLKDPAPWHGYDWRSDDLLIRNALAAPLSGLIFDVENNELWPQAWGPRPADAVQREQIVTDIVAAAPKLIPLYGHRYLPCEPEETGNPVFSIHQSDIIYYGENLADYLAREFGAAVPRPPSGPFKRIRFWSEPAESSQDWLPLTSDLRTSANP